MTWIGRRLGWGLGCLALAACTSKPYVIHTKEDLSTGQRTERVCTHKKALIPYYAVVVMGILNFRYGEKCHDEVSPLTSRSLHAVLTPAPVPVAEGSMTRVCPTGGILTDKGCMDPSTLHYAVPLRQPLSEDNRVAPASEDSPETR